MSAAAPATPVGRRDPLYLPTSRPERLIAGGRVVLAAASLTAVWLDPSEPAKYADIAYLLLVAYLIYASGIALWVWRIEVPSPRGRLVSHLFDLLFFSLFIYFTAGPGSPFTAFFVFALVCATLRWGWRGTLWTAVASLAALLAVAVYFGEVERDPSFQLHTSIIRAVYLGVMAVLLGYLGAHEERTRREMSALAAWPQRTPGTAEDLLREVLDHAARVMAAPRLLLVWAEREEPWSQLALWAGGEMARSREPPAALEPLVEPSLEGRSFLCAEVTAAEPLVRVRADGGFERWRGEPLHHGLVARYGLDAVASVPLSGEAVEGRLLVLDKPAMTGDDLVLAEVVAGVAAARFDHLHLTRQLQDSAATEERIRLARDLHDGVLQSFTGIALQLAAVRRHMEEDAAAARGGLEGLQRLIALEQRDLRFFISELKPATAGAPAGGLALPARLVELAERSEREWGLKVELALEGVESLDEELGRQVYHLVREALVNAVRHGDASEVRVAVTAASGRPVAVSVSDNGCGFAFHGRRDGETLARLNQGPKSLRERVASLGGSLIIDSSNGGARLDIALPSATP